MSTKQTGQTGEALAETFLKKHGYRMVEHNFRCKFGEIDLIAYKDKTLCFIEVKTRSSDAFGEPIDAVDRAKQKRLIRLANYYLFKKKVSDALPCRFDVVSILMGQDKTAVSPANRDKPTIELITNIITTTKL